MKNIHIKNSYNIWRTSHMKLAILQECKNNYDVYKPEIVLNRTYKSMYIEWWLHNIGYYVTRPFCFIEDINGVNKRFKDVDLEEWD